MSLVDYASSDDEEAELRPGGKQEEEAEEAVVEIRRRSEPPTVQLPTPRLQNLTAPNLPSSHNKSSDSNISKQKQVFSHNPEPSDLRLPDASSLLNSPSMPSHLLNATDHASRVAVAMAESASRKRDSTGLSNSYPRSKVPKGTLPHSKAGADTSGGLLLPPQLSGRSNVVTEDINKLFVKKHVDSSTS